MHIKDLQKRRDGTVFLTTHYLDEADALSDRIMVIDKGVIVASDTSDNLKEQIAGDLIELEVDDPQDAAVAARKLEAIGDGSAVTVDGGRVSGRVIRAGKVVPGLLAELTRESITLASIEVRRPTLDDVFLNLTGRSLRDA